MNANEKSGERVYVYEQVATPAIGIGDSHSILSEAILDKERRLAHQEYMIAMMSWKLAEHQERAQQLKAEYDRLRSNLEKLKA